MSNNLARRSVYLSLALLAGGCGSDEPELEPVLRPVVVEVVGYAGGRRVRNFSGVAESDKSIELSFRSSGILTRLDVRVGQRVQKGELLAELDNVEARLGHEQAVSSLNAARSQMTTAKLAFDRVRSLYEKGSSSLGDFESAKDAFRSAEASFESAQRSVDIQEEQIGYGYIHAPESGTIALVVAEVNENVSPGQTVATLNAGQEMEIAVGLPESVINEVSAGMDVDVTFPALEGRSFAARVTEVSPAIDADAATYPVRVRLVEPSVDVRSGMAANVAFDLSDAEREGEALVVPAKAVGEDGNGRFVFLVEESGATAKVKKQVVRVGELTLEGFEVLEGLEAGQKIATAGLQTLLDGQEVQPP